MSEQNGNGGGFERRLYKLTFKGDPAFDGLEVTCRAPSMRVLMAMEEKIPRAVMAAGASMTADAAPDLSGVTEDDAGSAIQDVLQMLSDQIVAWNVTENGKAVPVSHDSLMDQDFPMLMAILDAYQREVMRLSQVAPPLPKRSGSQQASPAAPRIQIPMTTLTPAESPAS
jgi:hypothetical protein